MESEASYICGLGDGVRGEREDEDRRVRRIDLAIGGVGGKVRGQLRAGGVDGRLHIARGAVDVAVEIELEDDAGGSGAGGRGHLIDAGDAGELALERRGDGGGHGLGVGAGQRCADGDDGVLDLGQRGDGKKFVGDGAGDDDRDGEQEGGDGALDEGRGEVDGVDASRRRAERLRRWSGDATSRDRRRWRGLGRAVAGDVVGAVEAAKLVAVAGTGAVAGVLSPGLGSVKDIVVLLERFRISLRGGVRAGRRRRRGWVGACRRGCARRTLRRPWRCPGTCGRCGRRRDRRPAW